MSLRRPLGGLAAAVGLSLASVATLAATKPAGTRIEFSAQAQRQAPNDLGRATAFVELAGPQLGELAQRANAAMTNALTIAKGYPAIMTETGTSQTTPVYGKGKAGSAAVESWRVRSELGLETRDAGALGELLGLLQGAGIAVSDVRFAPSPEARRKAEDEAALDAIRVFQQKATRYASAFKRPYRIRALEIRPGGVPAPSVRGAALLADDAHVLPVEPGSSTVVMVVKGEIELVE